MDPDDTFDAFFRARYTDLVAFVMRLGARLPDAEEAAQEAMVAAYVSWHRIRDPGAWTWRVAYRGYLRQVRRRRLRETLVSAEELSRRPADDEAEAELLWRDRFRRLLARLTDKQQRVVALWYDGYLAKEIAERLRIEPGTVRSIFRHARRRLVDLLGDPAADHPPHGAPSTIAPSAAPSTAPSADPSTATTSLWRKR